MRKKPAPGTEQVYVPVSRVEGRGGGVVGVGVGRLPGTDGVGVVGRGVGAALPLSDSARPPPDPGAVQRLLEPTGRHGQSLGSYQSPLGVFQWKTIRYHPTWG